MAGSRPAPAIIRGAIAVAWYGIQTYLASAALDVVVLKLWPSLAPYADVDLHGFLGLPTLGWCTYTLETLGAFIGPLFGVLIADFYLVRKQQVDVDDMFPMKPTGRYYYRKGVNPPAVIATAVGAVVAMIPVLWTGGPHMHTIAQYSWFIGMGLGFLTHLALTVRSRVEEPA